HTAQTGQRVRGDPSVGCDHHCHVVRHGLPCPQLPPTAAYAMGEVDGSGWGGSYFIASPRRIDCLGTSSIPSGRRRDRGLGWALITASATLEPAGLAHGALWWTERHGWYLHSLQDRRKH